MSEDHRNPQHPAPPLEYARPSVTAQSRTDYLPAAIALCLYVVVVLRTAWLSDDAYITLRTVENFVNGFGLRWNVDERVQAYTHPLWMLLLSGLRLLTGNIHYMTILTGVLLSVGAALFFATRVAISASAALIGLSIFCLSKAYVDYSTAGLENPLTHLLLLLLLFVYFTRPPERKTLFWLSLLTALTMLSRMDAVLLAAPLLCVAFYRVRSPRALGTVALGFTPLIAWEAFALFYYGSLFPNTAYAKLNTGIPAGDLIAQGLVYLLATLKKDPLTMIVIVAGLAAPLVLRQRRHLPVALGALLYVLYIVRIGGDFMVGRFLTPPLLIAVVLLSRASFSPRTTFLMLFLIVLIGVTPTRSPITSGEDYAISTAYLIEKDGVCDERAYYYHGTGLLNITNNHLIPSHTEAQRGRATHDSGETVVAVKAIGMHGFFAGPKVHLVDEMALADPLLARLKPDLSHGWRIGHFERRIPAGYLETLRTGVNVIADPNLAAYYDKLCIVTRGSLWDPHRWLEILKLNLGTYDHLLATAEPGVQSRALVRP